MIYINIVEVNTLPLNNTTPTQMKLAIALCVNIEGVTNVQSNS